MLSMFKGARNVRIKDSFVAVDHHGMTGLQLLHNEIAYGATHDSAERFPPPKCHPRTRRAIVKGIMDWIHDLSRLSSVLWLKGPAGCGKSAIAQTICELCQASGVLGGSFFFSRTDRWRNNSTLLFATIAYQLALAIPEVRDRINEIVANDPSIVNKSIDVQLQTLIVEPLQLVDLTRRPVVIIIDGLDECMGESMQCLILQLIGSIFERGVFPICFVVASRPEPWIKDKFESGLLSRNLRQVALEEADDTDEDIRAFLVSGFDDIRNSPSHRSTMSTLGKSWPSEDDIDALVDRASGQFVYPATVLKFVDDPNFRPADRLQTILTIPMATTPTLNPLADLDKLYVQILSTCVDKQRTLDVLGTLLAVLSDGLPLEWGPRPQVLDVVEQLLVLRPNESQLALRTIHSLVNVSSLSAEQRERMTLDEYQLLMLQDAVKFYHKSFSDFLLDSSRSGEYFIDLTVIHRRTALECLRIMQDLSLKPASRVNYVTWGYAILHWTYHFAQSGPPTVDLLDALQKFDLHHCFILTLDSSRYEEGLETIKRVVYPPRSLFGMISKRRVLPTATDTERDRHPAQPDVETARRFLVYIGAQNDFIGTIFGTLLQWLVNWLKKYPHPPQKLIAQYQMIIDILAHYGRSARRRPKVKDSYFRRNIPPNTLAARWRTFCSKFRK